MSMTVPTPRPDLKGNVELHLRPESSDGRSISALLVTLSLNFPDLESGHILFTLPTESSNTPCQNYDSKSLSARNQHGPIPLVKKISKATGDQEWWSCRPIQASEVVLQCLARPRNLDESTNTGARIDLRRERDGIQGCGSSFIPLPPWAKDGKSELEHTIRVEWDLSELQSSDNMRCIWTFGEGPGPVEVIGDLEYHISESQYMVGLVRSYPEKSNGRFGFYYFGDDTPLKVKELGPINENLFAEMSDMFEKDIKEKEPYRVFIRRSEIRQAFGGTAVSRSYILEYGDDLEDVRASELLFLLSHEMIHNWLLMNEEEEDNGGSDNLWYIEGIANFYGTFLPLRFGLVTELECIDQVNVLLCQYYTNPCRALTEAELDKDRWEDNLKVDVPYTKGFAFLLATDCLIRKSTKGRASLDDVALALLMQRRITYDIRQKNWIETLACYLESGLASQMLRNMLNGSLVILPNEIGAGRKLVRIEREEIETGFSLSDSGTVLKLVEGSRAAEAGIRLGDEILLQTPMYKLLENFQMNMEVKVKRGEEVFDLMYWPRSKRTVPCWEIQRV